jgi:hypothetical protein
MIRTTRPPKPWPKIEDLSVIFVADRLDKCAGKTIGSIWQHTFYPYKLYLPMSESDFDRLNTDMPNLVFVHLEQDSTQTQQVDAALEKCEGQYIAIVPSGFPVKDMWIENPLYALINYASDRQGFLPEQAADRQWAAVLRKDDLKLARKKFPDLSVSESLKAAGVNLRKPSHQEYPFQFDNMYHLALSVEEDGDWLQAAQMYEDIAEQHRNVLWMKRLAAKAFFMASDHAKAEELCCEVNRHNPMVDTLLLEAKIKRKKKKFNSAIKLLTTAANTLEGHELIWT